MLLQILVKPNDSLVKSLFLCPLLLTLGQVASYSKAMHHLGVERQLISLFVT